MVMSIIMMSFCYKEGSLPTQLTYVCSSDLCFAIILPQYLLSIYLSLVALESGPLRTSFSPMQTSCNDRSPTTPPSCSETSDPISVGPYSLETCCIYHRECRTEVSRLCESHTHYHYRYKSSAAVIIIFIIIIVIIIIIIIVIWAYYFYYYPCIYMVSS